MARTNEITIIGLVVAMFLTNLLLIGLVASYAYRATERDHRYDLLKEEYTRLIQQVDRDSTIKAGRLQEQIETLQFTMDRRFGLIEDKAFFNKYSQK